MQEEPFAIYASRRSMLLLGVGGAALAGVCLFFVSVPAASRPIDPVHLWGGLLAGTILAAAGLSRAVFPLPIIAIDTQTVVVRRFCMPARTIPLSDIQEIIIFRLHGVKQLGLRLKPEADRGVWKWIGTPRWNRFALGAAVDYVVPDPQCGGRAEEAADAISQVSRVPVTRT